MPTETILSDWLSILEKETRHDFPFLSFNRMLPSQSHSLFDSLRKQIFGFGMGALFNPGFCNLGKSGRKICPVGNTRMFYLCKEKKIEIFFPSCRNQVLTILWCFTSIHLFISNLFWILSKDNYDISLHRYYFRA